MKPKLLLLLLLLIMLVITGLYLFPEKTTRNFYLGGIQVNEADQNEWVSTLHDIGMNTVEVTVYAKQGDWDSDNFWWDEEDEGVYNEVRAAKAKGLNVVLILRIALDHAYERNAFLWHGMIMPTDSMLPSWLYKHEHFIMKWAKYAEEQDIEVLTIGSEMNALTATFPIDEIPELPAFYMSEFGQQWERERTMKFKEQLQEKHLWVRGNDNYTDVDTYLEAKANTYNTWAEQTTYAGLKENDRIEKMNARRALLQQAWLDLIKKVRSVYKGKLSYASNFDNYHEVGFWNALDMMGINAYFQLREAATLPLAPKELEPIIEKRWAAIFEDIQQFKKGEYIDHMPLLFTELGYTYRRNCTVEPWASQGFSVVGRDGQEQLLVWNEQPNNRQERALAVKALYTMLQQHPQYRLDGILYWKLTTHDYLIKEEPFVLHLSRQATDSLQDVLLGFLE